MFIPLEEIERIREMENSSGELSKRETLVEIEAYVGLEIVMSFIHHGHIRDFWLKVPFLRQPDFFWLCQETHFKIFVLL